MNDNDVKSVSFGIRIEQLLIASNIKPGDFYSSTGVSQQQFYNWKKRDIYPSALTALKIAQYLNTTVEFLITGKSENPLQPVVNDLQARLKKINEVASDID